MQDEKVEFMQASLKALQKRYNLTQEEVDKLTQQDIVDSREIASFEEVAKMKAPRVSKENQHGTTSDSEDEIMEQNIVRKLL